MIAWSIQAASECGVFDRIIVSTDDAEIAKIAEACGAEAPFVRPTELADDHTPTVPVIRHAVAWLEDQRVTVREICCLFATAPFVQPHSLREGQETLRSHPDTEFVLSATRFGFPIFRAVRQNHDGTISMFWPEHQLSRSQDLPVAYHEAGQFFWATRDALFAHDGIYCARSRMVLLPGHQVQDIDSEDDWARAEVLAQLIRATASGARCASGV